jgi:hypothetical protein
MRLQSFRLLVAAIVFLFINILVLIIYSEVIHMNPAPESSVDVILVARGRDREVLQYELWNKYFLPDYKVKFFVVHAKDIPIPSDDIIFSGRRFSSNYESDQDLFIHINEIIPSDVEKSVKFIWASDRVVPIQKVMPMLFERNKMGSRFFSGFNADATLLNVGHLFEPTIPVGLMEYDKISNFSGHYSGFLAHILSGRHHVFANVAQELLLPNPKNKAKTKASREMFQVAHLDRTHPDQKMLNEKLKEIWTSYL